MSRPCVQYFLASTTSCFQQYNVYSTSYHAVPSQEIVFQKLVVSMTKEGDDCLDHLGPFFLFPPSFHKHCNRPSGKSSCRGEKQKQKAKERRGRRRCRINWLFRPFRGFLLLLLLLPTVLPIMEGGGKKVVQVPFPFSFLHKTALAKEEEGQEGT